ncbi:uncharacterized protein LTHEOB_4669 [Lasiodiplodia theobromae]|uniref:uncharacterized protein n=1 Tax=Lasiodiplodia theobromae TaxID=45133 RepID=UPI0015C2DD4B|nr:uncharacterized protein LTHEOB_4669 [Lasiodiplodia theobromae]KAF4546017.1 hypothetical protein LTHEOB_4669 [Lasiodiplodia theobromae]
MASIASDDDHSSTTTSSDDHDTSFAEDAEPVEDTTTNELRISIPAGTDADAGEEAGGDKYGLQVLGYHNIFPNDFDVVTVHGLHGDPETTWKARDESKRNTVLGLEDFKDEYFRLMNFGYDSVKGLSKEGIVEEASKLLRQLTEKREERDKDLFRGIVFVCHDIGGAIVKQALCQAVTDPQYADIACSTKWIIFLGYPHRWHSVYDMEEKIARLVFSGPKAPQSNVMLHVKNLARAVIECNEAFVESKILLSAEILSGRSNLTDLNESIFNEYESTLRTGFTFSYDFSQPHAFLPCAEEMTDLRSMFGEFNERLRLSGGEVERAEEYSYLDALISIASPVRSIPLHRYRSHPLAGSQQYTNWLQNTRSDVLIVHGQRPTQRVSGAAFEDILLKSPLDDLSTYFSFDQQDDRYNNTRAFLATTAAQWVTREQVTRANFDFRNEMSRFHAQGALTDEDLVILLARVRSTYTKGETVFVLDNLDECVDKLSSFWRLVAEVFESREKPWKFLIFTKSADSLDEWLKSWPSIELENEFSPDDLDPCVRDEIDCRLDRFDTNYAVGQTVRRFREDLLRKCGNDIGLTRLLLQDLGNYHSQDTLTAALKALPDTNVEILAERALNAIPEEKRSLVARAITWVLFAFRPLSIGELHSALGISEQIQGSDSTNALADVSIFDFSNVQEVRFQHPKLRDIILQSENEWYDVKGTAHEMIVETCIKFLDTATAHDSLDAVCSVRHDVLSTPSVKPRTDLANYAVWYWDRHYSLAPDKSRLIPQVLDFFRYKASPRAWQMARWFMSNPISRTDRTYVSKLPILASTGLQDIYERWIEDQNVSQADEKLWLPYSVAEAARNGHRNMVLRLLRSVELDSTTAEYVLTAACSGGDEDILLDLISHIRTALPSFTWPSFLVRRASWIGHARVVQALIDFGADVSGKEGAMFGQCSLHVAARNSQLEVVKLLVKHDPNLVHAPDEDNTAPLYFATIRGNHEVVKVLLENGAPANDSVDIPIICACSSGAPAAVRLLLEHGAQTETVRDEDWKRPPLHTAVAENAARCVDVLLEFKADPNHMCSGGTALRIAAANNRLAMVKQLVECGADVNARPDEESQTPLHEATGLTSGGMEMAQYLLDHGADVNLRTPSSGPLFAACLANDADMTRLLLEKGASVNDVYSDIWTPLHGAFKSAEVTRLLLEAGADVDRVLEENGRSPLFLAAEWGQTDVVEALLEQGKADTNIRFLPRDEEYMSGFTPLAVALKENHDDTARLLLEYGADTSIKAVSGMLPIYNASTTELLRMVLEFRPDLSLEDADGDTALNAIMHRLNPELADAKLLVHAGADVNAANKEGRTPLHKALAWNHFDIARFLLKRGAETDINALSGGTPLHLACWSGTIEGVRLMVEKAGADINIVNGFLGSPAQAACRRASPLDWGFEEVVVPGTLDMLRCLVGDEDKDSPPSSSAGTTNSKKKKKKTMDVNAPGGLYGSALGAAAYHATVPVIQFLLSLGARTDIRDQSGRSPIHLAAAASSSTPANFEALRDANADLYARDKAGRTVVHFAIVSGRLDVLQCVLAATDGLLDVADDDGWTPLHYAARGTYHRFAAWEDGDGGRDDQKHEMVAWLVEQGGADVWAVSSEGKRWSPLKLANYHGAKKETLELLTPRIKTSAEGRVWVEEEHASKRAFEGSQFCDACLFKVCGVRYRCKDCWDFNFCYKCYARRDVLHPDHEWEIMGQEFEDDPVSEPEAAEEDSESDDDTDCDSDDSDDSSSKGSSA